MKFAVIGDIHSNKFALESVLEDIELKNVHFIISTGDLVGYLPFPNEVIDTIRKNKILCIQGNHDQRVGEAEAIDAEQISNMPIEEARKKASLIFTSWAITNENRNYLKQLPKHINLGIDDLNLIIVHGSPNTNTEYLFEDDEILMKIANSSKEDIIISGHTHLPYHKVVNNKHFINAGSVGKPKSGDPRATYIIVSVEDNVVESEIVKVDYDINSMVEAINNNPIISNSLIDNLKYGK